MLLWGTEGLVDREKLIGPSQGEDMKWINVKDRLPEEQEEIVFVRCGYLAFGYLHFDQWFDLTMRDRDGHPHEYYSGVTHWMPLPAPPEDK